MIGEGCEREKIKIIVPFRSYQTLNRKFEKNRKKFQKIKKIQLWLRSNPKLGGKDRETEKIKINILFRYYSPRNRNFKKLKNTIMASFQAKINWGRLRKGENKNYRSVSFVPDA